MAGLAFASVKGIENCWFLSQLSSAKLAEISINWERALGFFFAKTLFSCSASFKKQGWENSLVGNLLSKSKDFAGDITIFMLGSY
jgi:hypothetical protein